MSALPQAFPHGDPTHGGDIGMTLRDWFAGQALAGQLGSDAFQRNLASVCTREDRELNEATAKLAFQYADAMLAERAKGGVA